MNFLSRRSTQYLPFLFRRAPIGRLSAPLATFSSFKHWPMQAPTFRMSKAKEHYQTVNRSVEKGSGYFMEQLLTGCLSLYSYYIESDGEALIIDPINEIHKYEEVLKERKTKLKYICLTHFHADYVAGHLELQKKYKGCEIIMGPKSHVSAFNVKTLKDGDELKLGKVSVKLIHTPGHTEESSCFLLLNEDHRAQDLFTGDTMFLNEVGRPDLAVKSGLTSRDLANLLFESIDKLKKLPDHVKIYPGHGAGSACGKNIGSGDYCTLENQKKSNYALKFNNKQEFADEILKGMPTPPPYFFNVVAKNKNQPFDFVPEFNKANKGLSLAEFKAELAKPNTHVIDIRGNTDEYFRGIIKGAFYIGHFGPFANYVGALLPPKDNYLIIGDKDLVEDAIKRLIRIGYLNVKGYNSFPFSDWDSKDTVKYTRASLHDLKKAQKHENDYYILDVRNKGETETGIFEGRVVKIPIAELEAQIKAGKLSKEHEYIVHCSSGYRSKIAATILLNHRYKFAVLPEPFSVLVSGGATVIQEPKEAEVKK